MLFALLALACGTAAPPADTGAATSAPTWHADVQPILARSCMGCHQDGSFGGFSLTTYAEAHALRAMVADAVAQRRMPPWLASDGCTPYEGDLSLSQEEIDTIVAWAEADGPEGEPVDAPAAIEPLAAGNLTRTDYTLPMPQAYMPEGNDDYRCFVVDWPLDEGSFVTGYDFDIGSPQVVHHVIAYLAGPDRVEDYRALDAADGVEGDGYTCYGGPGLVSQEDAAWLGGWAPGGVAGDLPPGTGVWVEGGGAVVLQLHYNTEAAGSMLDQSALRVMVEDSVQHPGIVQPWANPLWLYGDAMLIPAGEEGVTHEWGYALGSDYLLWTANLHMHKLGRSARLWIDKADGSEDCMLDIPRWDFNWQRSYRFVEAKELGAGEPVNISCTFDNPTDEDVAWGDGTEDEMCLGTFLITLP